MKRAYLFWSLRFAYAVEGLRLYANQTETQTKRAERNRARIR